MNLKLKSHKFLKTKLILKKNSLILISHKLNKNNDLLNKKDCKCYLARTKILKKLLKNSLICNLNPLINGKIVLIILKSYNEKKFFQFKNKIIGLMLNKKLYSVKQLKNLKTLNYSKNIKILHNSLKLNLIKNTLKLKKFRNNVI